MNVILRTKPGGWYVAGIVKDTNFYDQQVWVVRAKFLHPDGTLQGVCLRSVFHTRVEAEKACRKLARRKCRDNDMVPMSLEDLPKKGCRELEPDPDNWVNPDEMMELLWSSRRERYVYFENVDGIDGLFQLGLEYLAYTTEDDEILEVHADDGSQHNCLTSRFSRIENTERTEQALKSIVSQTE